MKKWFFLCFIWSFCAAAQSLPTPQSGKTPLHIVFKDLTDYPTLRRFALGLQQTKLVDSFVMTKAKRGLIEYGGSFFGEASALLEAIHQASEGKFRVESQVKEGVLEIFVTPQSS